MHHHHHDCPARVTLPLCCPSNCEADDNYTVRSVVSAGAEQIRCEDVTTQHKIQDTRYKIQDILISASLSPPGLGPGRAPQMVSGCRGQGAGGAQPPDIPPPQLSSTFIGTVPTVLYTLYPLYTVQRCRRRRSCWVLSGRVTAAVRREPGNNSLGWLLLLAAAWAGTTLGFVSTWALASG